MPVSDVSNLQEIGILLRGDPDPLATWTRSWTAQRFALHILVIIVGAGLYGAAMGWWRDPQQAFYVAVKFPLIILLTTGGNALLNAMLAPLLGMNLPFRQSFAAVVMSFTVTAAILGGFSPLIAFLVWNTPAVGSANLFPNTYNSVLLVHVTAIALAGVMGNVRLSQLLVRLAGNPASARRVLWAWLTMNLFLGSQLSWILRPFIGSPGLPVEFFRRATLHGNFFEAVFHSLQQLLFQCD